MFQEPPAQKLYSRENFLNTPPVYMRETGTIWQIGVLTAERSIFWAKNM